MMSLTWVSFRWHTNSLRPCQGTRSTLCSVHCVIQHVQLVTIGGNFVPNLQALAVLATVWVSVLKTWRSLMLTLSKVNA